MNKPITFITGTRKGIGRYLAEYYIKSGHIVIGCSRKKIDYKFKNYDHFILDINDEKAVNDMLKKIKLKYKRIDNLINNAGIASMNHSMLMPSDTVKKIFDTNVTSTFCLTRKSVKLIKNSPSGRIINFSSIAVPLGLEGEAIYAASKSAIETYTRILAKELSEYKITINAIGPTPIETDLIGGISKEKITNLIKNQAIKRVGRFEDISNVLDFLLNKKSSFITGQVIYLGGIS